MVAALATALAVVGAASAHGDPSTHALEGDSLYPAVASRPSQAVELRLIGLLRAAERHGYPIKVALVANEYDLAEDTWLLRKPQAYAEFVASQLGPALKTPLLVITPYGVGIAGTADRAQARLLLRHLRISRQANGNELARAATIAVRRLAAAAGRPLPAHVAPATAVWGGATAANAGDGLPVRRAVVLFVGLFGLSWLGYEVRSARARRRAWSA